jgi:hypothetical protein
MPYPFRGAVPCATHPRLRGKQFRPLESSPERIRLFIQPNVDTPLTE